MRRWIMVGAALSVLALAGCEEEEEGLEYPAEGPTALVEDEQAAEGVETDVQPSAGAAQHPPPEGIDLEPGELPEDQVAGAAQHPLPGDAPAD